ncbi:MAG: hypothetical protein ACXIUD_12250 [Mongoliitalea sp.]
MQLKHILTSLMIISLIGYSHSTIGQNLSTIGQNLFNKELDFTATFTRDLGALHAFSPITKGEDIEMLSEAYYLILTVKNGTIDSIIFSENTTERSLRRYNQTYLDEFNSKIKEMEIEFQYDCSILVPVFKYWGPNKEHVNKIEDIIETLFPTNKTFDCIHIAKPLIITMFKSS